MVGSHVDLVSATKAVWYVPTTHVPLYREYQLVALDKLRLKIKMFLKIQYDRQRRDKMYAQNTYSIITSKKNTFKDMVILNLDFYFNVVS